MPHRDADVRAAPGDAAGTLCGPSSVLCPAHSTALGSQHSQLNLLNLGIFWALLEAPPNPLVRSPGISLRAASWGKGRGHSHSFSISHKSLRRVLQSL